MKTSKTRYTVPLNQGDSLKSSLRNSLLGDNEKQLKLFSEYNLTIVRYFACNAEWKAEQELSVECETDGDKNKITREKIGRKESEKS